MGIDILGIDILGIDILAPTQTLYVAAHACMSSTFTNVDEKVKPLFLA